MKTIWKYEVAVRDELRIEMPSGARILHVEEQPGNGGTGVCMWALVDSKNPMEMRKFIIFGTGHDIPDAPAKETDPDSIYADVAASIVGDILKSTKRKPIADHYVATFLTQGGSLVWHMFEKPDWME